MDAKNRMGTCLGVLAAAGLVLNAGAGGARASGVGGAAGDSAIAPVPAWLDAAAQPAATPDPRMNWWREARFGMFIHWGLYAVPAGEWKGNKDHGEWIMNTGHIPVEEYEKFRDQFNPAKFNADTWVKLAKQAGMRYIVITSKHHDGFNLFDSSVTDYDVMTTPFKRDIMKEMADACHREGVQICWYHSIMDWHHPDYTPRRDWETRPTTGADFDRYVTYLKAELKDLLTKYGKIGLIWFDGQWEGTWNNDLGRDLQAYVRGLQPDIIINSRVGRGGGAYGLDDSNGGKIGDYMTPEQFIPDTNPGTDWETCMTMNEHWGYNRVDKNFKSTQDLVRNLVDIASKGGNYLLNVGPTPEGEIPPESIERLKAIGAWMSVNGDSIHGSLASPFPNFDWGRCTRKVHDGGKTSLYLHVFDWPSDGKLIVNGLLNGSGKAYLMTDASKKPLPVTQKDLATAIDLPKERADKIDSVIVLDLDAAPDVSVPPTVTGDSLMFVGSTDVKISTTQSNVKVHYTLDGGRPSPKSPTADGPVHLTKSSTVRAQSYRGDRAVSAISEASFKGVAPRPALTVASTLPGLSYDYLEGDFDKAPDFKGVKPKSSGVTPTFTLKLATAPDRYAFRFSGYVSVPTDGVYTFSILSDDGSRLWIDDAELVDNDGLHSSAEKSGDVALAKGLHRITATYFEKTGGAELSVSISGPGIKKQPIPASILSH